MKVEVHLISSSQPIIYTGIINTYTKGGMYCIQRDDGLVDKYPFVNIFRVRESYNK